MERHDIIREIKRTAEENNGQPLGAKRFQDETGIKESDQRVREPGSGRDYRPLLRDVQELADEKFKLPKSEPRHPALHLRKVGRFWSCRVGLHHRAVGVDALEQGGIAWFWIGTHADYDKLLG